MTQPQDRTSLSDSLRSHLGPGLFAALLASCGVANNSGADGAVDRTVPRDVRDTGTPPPQDVPGIDATPGTDAGVTTDTPAPGVDVAPDVQVTPPGVPFVFVGTRDGTIRTFAMDPATAVLTPRSRVTSDSYPSFLAVDSRAWYLYAANENSNRVSAYSINPRTGELTLLNTAGTGNGPAFVSVDRSDRQVMVAAYGGGNVSVYPIGADGRLGAETAPRRNSGMNPHSILTDPSNRYAFVPCLGSNYIAQYGFDPATGVLTPNGTPTVAAASGAGPRHHAYHPDGRHVYVINEINDTVTGYNLDTTNGTLASFQTISSLPAGANGGSNTCADVHISPSGRFLYGSNRGNDSIVVYSIDATSGMLTLVGHQSTGGNTPRNFGIDPTGTFLFAANQGSNNIVAFRIGADGMLTRLGTTSIDSAPHFVGVVTLPGR